MFQTTLVFYVVIGFVTNAVATEDCGQDIGPEYVCCGGHKFPLSLERNCCQYEGKQVYVLRKECQDGRVWNSMEQCGNQGKINITFQGCCGGLRYELGNSYCCLGSLYSHPTPLDTQCCNGQGMKRGDICCFDTSPVTPADKSHNACCRNTDTDVIMTYDNSTSYCSDTGTPQKLPSFAQPLLLSLKMCGAVTYMPAIQTCCVTTLYNISANEAECCYDKAYRANSADNPCKSKCGDQLMNRETQLCCNGEVFNSTSEDDVCCGATMINQNDHTCCRNNIPLERKKGFACCGNNNPFHLKTMKCDERTGNVQFRSKHNFQSVSVCNKTLLNWGSTWPQLIQPDMLHIRGVVEQCSLKVTRTKISINLTPVITQVGGQNLSMCLRKGFLSVVVHTKNCILARKELQKYFHRKTLDIYFRMDALSCKSDTPRLSLRDNVKAFMLLSQNDNLAQYSTYLRL